MYYFDKPHRMWANDNPCEDCVIVHNNWIYGKPAKIYRFKEHLMWMMDENGYFSNPDRKYLVYENPVDWGIKSAEVEISTLKLALQIGHMINRTVILPGFTCRSCRGTAGMTATKRCALNCYLQISTFDGVHKGMYREHMFLSHPKVPEAVKNSTSPTLLIGSKEILQKLPMDKGRKIAQIFQPWDSKSGATESEIVTWFGSESVYNKYSVLKFHSLYKAFQGFDENSDYMKKLNSGFKTSVYKQY